MRLVTRRGIVAAGAGTLATAALPRRAGAAVASTFVEPPKFDIEKGARLRVVRPSRFIDPDQAIWNANSRAFTKATGIPVRVDYVGWEDLRPQTAVTADTGGGPDVIVGWSDDPQLYASQLLDMTDLADYLGAKYGGWKFQARVFGRRWQTDDWISIPMGAADGPLNYRVSWLHEAGFDAIPDDLDRFLALCQALRKNGHPPGFALGNSVGDANGYANWLLWSHGALLVDEEGHVAINRSATIDALRYARAMQETLIPGTLGWLDPSNNKAFLAGDIGITQNGLSIYFVAQSNPRTRPIADDMDFASMPRGVSATVPQAPLVINAMVFKHSRYPNAAKEYIRFMMEQEQYEPWLNGCIGYWGNTLKAFDAAAVWDTDPKLALFRHAADHQYWTGYKGPVSAASAAVAANYITIRMFAAVASGSETPEDAAFEAERQAKRYYRG